jgi:hypothetical protein
VRGGVQFIFLSRGGSEEKKMVWEEEEKASNKDGKKMSKKEAEKDWKSRERRSPEWSEGMERGSSEGHVPRNGAGRRRATEPFTSADVARCGPAT